jgi:16S rRNA (uracil1498-N3)-methyltransferase
MSDELTTPGGKLRLYVDAALGEGARVIPNDAHAHYLLHVMRSKVGDRISLFNGRDGEWLARVAEIAKRTCTLECERRTAPQNEVPDLWLVFAPIKKTPADYLGQKATELGVRVLQPVITRRTIVTRVNVERMRANAVEAAEQSGRLTVPEVHEPLTFDRLLAGWPRERRILFCDEAGEAPPIAEALRAAPEGPWAVVTGPEGGFDPAERARLREQPFVTPVSLGDRILRADTAALAALAVWQAVKGDWPSG